MNVRITVPIEARHVVPDQLVVYDRSTWVVDEVRHGRDQFVSIVMHPLNGDTDAQTTITKSGWRPVHLVPTSAQFDALKYVIADALADVWLPSDAGLHVGAACEVFESPSRTDVMAGEIGGTK